MAVAIDRVIEALLASDEPSVQYKVRAGVLGEPEDSPAIGRLRQQIRRSPRVQRLLAGCRAGAGVGVGVYAKWQGAHWVMAALADIGYPAGDRDLAPIRDQILHTWLDKDSYYTEFEANTKAAAYGRTGIPVLDGRHRAHGSQQGNALWCVTRLGLADRRCDALAERLLHWQWADGGWNCDKRPEAHKSSFAETLLPMRGLHIHAQRTGDSSALAGARRAADFFLRHELAYRTGTARLAHPEFGLLHYPAYWHFDILVALKAMAQLGLLHDPGCAKALDLLESLRVDGGWPAHKRYYRKVSDTIDRHADHVDWSGAGSNRPNPWTTADALTVLRAAGRL